jgi:hypothetical protein
MGSVAMSDEGQPVENSDSSDEIADVAQLDEDAVASSGTDAEPTASASPVATHSPAELSRALQAFKKRLKLTKLDSESKLGYGPMTGGRPSGIVAITPPREYPRSVWDALVEQGRLKRGSQGMYELA